jgi:small subunit ribosomal protein S2
VVAIIDSNTVPQKVDYPIPGNDDSRRAIRLYTKTIADTILAARTAVPADSDIESLIEIDLTAEPASVSITEASQSAAQE